MAYKQSEDSSWNLPDVAAPCSCDLCMGSDCFDIIDEITPMAERFSEGLKIWPMMLMRCMHVPGQLARFW